MAKKRRKPCKCGHAWFIHGNDGCTGLLETLVSFFGKPCECKRAR